jgi:hypothetical protein
MAWVSSLVSVSSSRLPGRTCPSGRWLGVSREVSLAAARSVVRGSLLAYIASTGADLDESTEAMVDEMATQTIATVLS